MASLTIGEIQARLQKTLQPHQREAAEDARKQAESGSQVRLCLYHRTGAGKTITALSCAAYVGVSEALVVTPPVTQAAWVEVGARLGITVTAISHAKFRQKGYRVHRDVALIVDEFHLLGGHTGQGWKKLDKIAAGIKAPVIICSATPNYNDIERAYCVQHVLDPLSVRGGFLQFIYEHCNTRQNPFGATPIVESLKYFADTEAYLASLPYVHYVEDNVIKQAVIGSITLESSLPEEFETYGLDRRRGRIIASKIEGYHAAKRYNFLDDNGYIRDHVFEELAVQAGDSVTPSLVYCDSATIAEALYKTCTEAGVDALIVTGKTPLKTKNQIIDIFKEGDYDILIGTATLATGTDGVDKMCNTLLILDDCRDDSLRRQLMGRILPRGLDQDITQKIITRFSFE